MERTHYRVQSHWFVLMPLIIATGISVSCDSIWGTQAPGAGEGVDGAAVSLRLENNSGMRVSVEATFRYANSVVRTTSRLLTAFGPESAEVVLLTLSETVTVVARADEASPLPANARVERGDLLLERVYRQGEDYLAGGTILFVIPPLDEPSPSIIDCNNNGIADGVDISSGTSLDCDSNSVPDECDIRDNPELDCNDNGVLDQCDIESATSRDQNGNGIPDECEPQGLMLTMDSPFVSLDWPARGVVWLLHAAPVGGMPIELQIADLNIATVVPENVVVQEGRYGVVFEVHGVQAGTTILTATAAGLSPVTTTIEVTDAAIDLADAVEVAPGESVSLPLSLSVPAPVGGVYVLLESDDADTATVTSSVLIPEGSLVPLMLPIVTGKALGSATITASSPGYLSDTAEVLVRIGLSFDHGVVSIREGESVDLRLRMTASVPGLQINLDTDDNAVATVPTIFVAGVCETCQVVTVTGVGLGTTVLRASAVGVEETTAVIEVVGEPEMYFGDLLVGNDLETAHDAYARYLAEPAPTGGVDVTLVSQDPSRVLLALLPGDVGSGNLVVHVPSENAIVPQFFVQGLDDGLPDLGPVEVMVSAPGYVNTSFDVSLVPSGFVISWPGDFVTTPLSGDQPVCVCPVCLDPVSSNVIAEQQIRGGVLPFGVDLTSTDPLVGSISPSPLVFYAGIAELCADFSPLATGTTDILLDAPDNSEWQTPTTGQELTATVEQPLIQIQDISVGVDLQKAHYSYDRRLSEPAPAGGCVVTLTSSDPAKVKLLTGGKCEGTAIIHLTVSEGSRQIPSFYVQGLADDGIVEVSASAPGYYCESSFNVTLGPSGFYIDSPWSEFHTTPLSQDTEIVIALARLNPSTLEVIYEWPQPQLRGGLSSCSVMVQSNDPAVGNVTASPVVFYSGDSEVSTWFEPASAGIATVGIQQLPKFGGRSTEFSTPADMQEVTAYVDNPTINISDDAVGKNLQTLPSSYNHRLSVEAPAGGVDVTLTSQDPARVLLSPDGEAIGSADLVLHVPAGSRQIPPFYVQGLDDSGMVTVDAVASGFEAGEFGVVFYPAGFCIATPNSIHTTAFSDPSSIGIRSTRLAHGTMDTLEYQSVRGGASPVDVAITCSDTLVGTITTSPVVVQPNVTQVETGFDPHREGAAVITLATPVGYAAPSTRQSIGAIVANPGVVLNPADVDVDVGLGLQIPITVYLNAPPPSPVDVVVTSCAEDTVSVSLDGETEGGASVVFPGVTGTNVGTVYVQGRGLSCATLTGTANGYAGSKCQVTVSPAGFFISSPSDFTTTPNAADVPVYVQPAWLDLTTLDVMYAQPVRGGLAVDVDVDVTSSDIGVGVIGTSPLAFPAGTDWQSTYFDVLAVGTTDIGVFTPFGFATPSNGQFVRATVREWPAEGACCLSEGWCLELAEAECFSFGGAYQGDGSYCFIGLCDPVVGACCLPDYSCSEESESSCLAAGGEYQGAGSYCMTGLCDPVIGACCLPDYSCSEGSESSCLAAGGIYQGDGSYCFTGLCDLMIGACCLPGPVCLEIDSVSCSNMGGTYFRNAVSCASSPCPP